MRFRYSVHGCPPNGEIFADIFSTKIKNEKNLIPDRIENEVENVDATTLENINLEIEKVNATDLSNNTVEVKPAPKMMVFKPRDE